MKKLIILMGIPGVGKYTIGQKLHEKMEGFIFLHNHLTINFGHEVYPDDGEKRKKFITELREFIFSKVIENENILTTLAIGLNSVTEEKFLELYESIAHKKNADFYVIYLSVDQSDYINRITSPDRKRLNKLTNKETALSIFENHSKSFEPSEHWIKIDTTGLSPDEIAGIINDKIC